jgi:hypothetical protein
VTTVAMIDAYSLGIKLVRKKPVTVFAVEITQNNYTALMDWIRDLNGRASLYDPNGREMREHGHAFWVETLEDWRPAKFGEYLIRGTEGEFYPIKKQVYMNCYEDVPQEGYQED